MQRNSEEKNNTEHPSKTASLYEAWLRLHRVFRMFHLSLFRWSELVSRSKFRINWDGKYVHGCKILHIWAEVCVKMSLSKPGNKSKHYACLIIAINISVWLCDKMWQVEKMLRGRQSTLAALFLVFSHSHWKNWRWNSPLMMWKSSLMNRLMLLLWVSSPASATLSLLWESKACQTLRITTS